MLRYVVAGICLLALTPLALASPDKKTLALVIASEGEFEVLFHRAQSTVTGAAIGGLIGAAIEEGVRNSQDSDKKSQLLPHISDASCINHFRSALLEKLANKKIDVDEFPSSTIKAKDKDDGLESDPIGNIESNNYDSFNLEVNQQLLSINITNCGFKLVDLTSEKVAAFIDFKSSLTNKADSENKENNLFLGKKSYTFETLVQANSNAEEELTSVLKKAGRRVANKIIYGKK